MVFVFIWGEIMKNNWQVPVASIWVNEAGKWLTNIIGCIKEHDSLEAARATVVAAGYKVRLQGDGKDVIENWIG